MDNKCKKTILERYGIPIHHLDFKYIQDCTDGREMEKIVHILRSNEEGYYPDLTKCAEEKLKQLKPQSRLFRVEEQIRGRESLDPNELKPFYDWNQDIKLTDKKLQKLEKETTSQYSDDVFQLPPIRKNGKILQAQNATEKTSTTKKENPSCQRIKSTDYSKWDKYDAEEEILHLDLAEERQQEEVERKNRLNMEKCIKMPLEITEVKDDQKSLDKWGNLSEVEREKLSEEYRLRGNEYFRSKEYDLALKEYSWAIECCPKKAASAFNNRALTHYKQQKFLDAIKDCEDCLKIEPSNLKARLRYAEASYAYGRRKESYQLYINVLKIDPENVVALKAINELREQFEDLPPPNATRLHIEERPTKTITKPLEVTKPQPKPQIKTTTYDLAELVKPNRVVPNKLFKAAESLGKHVMKKDNKSKLQEESNDRELRLPGNCPIKNNKKLIQDI